VPLEVTASRADPALLDLPWSVPLEDWPADRLAALPRGISRHTVRFVRVSNRVLAIKEIKVDLARREYAMLRNLERMDLPCVEPFGVVSGRQTPEGLPLGACPLTRPLQDPPPYRGAPRQAPRPGTAPGHRRHTVIQNCCARRLQGTFRQPVFPAQRGGLSAWYSSARRRPCSGHRPV
jgi:hypothetical protein